VSESAIASDTMDNGTTPEKLVPTHCYAYHIEADIDLSCLHHWGRPYEHNLSSGLNKSMEYSHLSC